MKRTAGKSLRTRKAMEQAIHLIFLLCGIVAVGFVLCISVYLVISGLPAIREIGLTKFLFGKVWAPTNATTGPQFGILPFILTSVYGTAGALLLGVPVGLMTAIFLAKVAPPQSGGDDPHGGAAAGGHPVGGVRSGGHDRTGPRHPPCLRPWLRGLPAGGHSGADGHDAALHHQRGGDGPSGRAEGV